MPAPDAMKVTVFTTMPPGVYSGGRYLSMMLAYSLSRAGADVCYVTDNSPLFERDFVPFQRDFPIRMVVSSGFEMPGERTSDWVFVIPTGGFDSRFYGAALQHARTCKARVALLCFETPNWFAALSPFPRSPLPTESWRQVVAEGGLVVTIAEAGVEPARAYFGPGRDGIKLDFGHWHPPINDLAATGFRPTDAGRKRVVMFARTEDPHKGAQDLLTLPPSALDGHILSLVFGRGVPDGYVEALRCHFAPARDFGIEIHHQITDEEKFRLLSKSRLLLFPSYFEGYGYPPVEAAWMGTPTLAYDLPLLREVAGAAVSAVPVGDTAALGRALDQILSGRGPGLAPGDAVRAALRVAPDTLNAGRSLLNLLGHAEERVDPVGSQPTLQPIRRGETSVPPSLRRLAAWHGPDWHLFDLEARVAGDRLQVSGRIAGADEGDILCASMPGAVLPEAVLRAPRGPDMAQGFVIEGSLELWPGKDAEATLSLDLRRTTGEAMCLGTVAVRGEWPCLLSRGVAGSRLAPATVDLPEVVVAADPELLLADPLAAMMLAEVAEVLFRLGRRTVLLMPDDAPAVPAGGDLDLMPRFDRIEVVPAERMRDRLAELAALGPVVLAAGPLEKALGNPDAVIGPDAAAGPGREIAVHLGGPARRGARKTARHAVTIDARLASRHLADRSREAVVVLLPDQPMDGLPATLDLALKRAEAGIERLRVLVPLRLWCPRVAVPFGLAGVVEPVTDSQLGPAAASVGRVVAVVPGSGRSEGASPDAVGAALLSAVASVTPIVVSTAEDSAALLAALALPPVRPGTIGAVIGTLVPPAPHPGGLRALHLGRPVVAVPPVPRPLPVLAQDQVLSLSSLSRGSSPALLEGWQGQDIHGAGMESGSALLAFEVKDLSAGPMRIELLLQAGVSSKPAFALWVSLNRHLLGRIDRTAGGIAAFGLAVPPQAWNPGGPQVLTLAQVRPVEAGTAPGLTLMAVSLLKPASPSIDWARQAPSDAPRAPLLTPTLDDAGPGLNASFAIGRPAGFAVLLGGWSQPESEWTWSDGPTAAIGFPARLAVSGPVTLRLVGRTLDAAPTHRVGQRLRLNLGITRLAEGVTAALPGLAAEGGLTVALPPSLTSEGVDHLMLGLPDAVRPVDAGLGTDARSLGLALARAEMRILVDRVGQATVPGGGFADAASVSLIARAGALVLKGRGPMPRNSLFMTIPGRCMASAVRSADGGGWEVAVPLSADELARGQVLLCCLGDPGPLLGADPGLDPQAAMQIESWAEAAPMGGAFGSGPITIGLHAAPRPTGDPRDWLTNEMGQILADHALPRGQLPAGLSLIAESPDLRSLSDGWSWPEAGGTWTDGPQVRIALPGALPGAIITLRASALIAPDHPRQRVTVLAAGTPVATLHLTEASHGAFTFVLPRQDRFVTALDFALPDAVSPATIGLSTDTRSLGLFVTALDLSPHPPIGAGSGLTATAESAGLIAGEMRMSAVARVEAGLALLIEGEGPGPWGLGLSGRSVIAHPKCGAGIWWAWLVVPDGQPQPQADGWLELSIWNGPECRDPAPVRVLAGPAALVPGRDAS